MSEATEERRHVQVARLLIMMYRQGWLDASQHLAIETDRQARRLRRDYDQLVAEGEALLDELDDSEGWECRACGDMFGQDDEDRPPVCDMCRKAGQV